MPLFSIFLIFLLVLGVCMWCILWWKPQVCPGSPLAQGIFNLARNLKTVYELSGAHLPPFLRSAKITTIQGRILRNFWFSIWWVVFLFLFFKMKKFFQAAGAGCPCALHRCVLLSTPAPCEAEWRVESTGTRAWGLTSLESSGALYPTVSDLVHLLFLISAVRQCTLQMLLLIFFFKCKVKVLVASCARLQPHGL